MNEYIYIYICNISSLRVKSVAKFVLNFFFQLCAVILKFLRRRKSIFYINIYFAIYFPSILDSVVRGGHTSRFVIVMALDMRENTEIKIICINN